MKRNDALIAELQKLGFVADVAKNSDSTIIGPLSAYLRMVEVHESLPYSSSYNGDMVHSQLTDGREHFKGGTFDSLKQNLSGDIDLARFIAAKEKLNKGGLIARLKTRVVSAAPKRKRIMSEYEGELDFDRRFEIQPFHATHRLPTQNRTVTIRVNFSISGGEGAENIDAYGAICWSIIDLIESAGIQCKVIMEIGGKDTARGQAMQTLNAALKVPGQYLAPNILAAALQTNFFRRIGFAGVALGADLAKQDVYSNLGHPLVLQRRIEFRDGALWLSPALGAGGGSHVDMAELEREILKAIGKPARKAAA